MKANGSIELAALMAVPLMKMAACDGGSTNKASPNANGTQTKGVSTFAKEPVSPATAPMTNY